jgi:uncharacterized membrane protein YsdA (DUF1294 family)
MSDLLIIWLLFVNALTFLLMIFDKRRAESGDWRIAEGTILFWCFFGGSAGALAASQRVRHKTRKQPFAGRMRRYLVYNIIVVALIVTGLAAPLFAWLVEVVSLLAQKIPR